MTHLLLILNLFVPQTHACGVDVIAADEAARQQIQRVAAGLPVLFRFEVTYDDRLAAVVATPKCVTAWQDETEAWTASLRVPWGEVFSLNWSLDVGVPSITRLVKTQNGATVTYAPGEVTENTVRLNYDRWSFNHWSAEILRAQPPAPPLALPLDLPSCARHAVNTFSYRLKNGTLISPELWRYQRRHASEGQSCSM